MALTRRCNNCGSTLQLTRISKSELDIDINGRTTFCFNESEQRSFYQCSNCNLVSRDINSVEENLSLLNEISYIGEE